MISIKDIAREAGVSHPTVSCVLNGRAKKVRISEKTQRKVLETAKRMGYCRDEVARSIKTGKSNIIGFVSRPCHTESFAKVLSGIMQSSFDSGYFVKVIQTGPENPSSKIADICQGQRLAGAIFYGLEDQTEAEAMCSELLLREIPCVLAAGNCRIKGVAHVANDNEMAGRLVFEHLHSLGHRHFMILNFENSNPKNLFLPRHQESSAWIVERMNGFLNAANESGIDISELKCPDDIYFSDAEILEIAKKRKPVTAFYCPNDYAALALMTKLSKQGVLVPQDVSIVGHGDISFAGVCEPTLTTVNECLNAVGVKAFELLLAEITGKNLKSNDEDSLDRIGVELIIRESTGEVK